MARKKRVESVEREAVSVPIRLIPYYGIRFDIPSMRGITAVGETPERAMQNARGELARRFPERRFDLTVTEQNPEVFARAGVHYEQET